MTKTLLEAVGECLSESVLDNILTESLQSALKDLEEYLVGGTRPDRAVKDVAEEYGLNPRLLERKFQEQYKSSPKDYAKEKEKRASSVSTADSAMEKNAKEAAMQHVKLYLTGGSTKDTGSIFKIDNTKYAFIGLVRSSKGPKVRALIVKSGKFDPSSYVHWPARNTTSLMKIIRQAQSGD